MNEVQLRARLETLLQQRAGHQQQLNQLTSQAQQLQEQAMQVANNINAFNGAIQECEHWLAILIGPASPVTLVPDPVGVDGKPVGKDAIPPDHSVVEDHSEFLVPPSEEEDPRSETIAHEGEIDDQ